MWNDLLEELTKAESIPVFKRKIKIWLNMKNLSGINFDIRDHSHQGFLGKVLIQMRFKLSPLRSQLFKYNLIDNPFCPTCGDFFETTDHYFFECNHYVAQRQSLINDIAMLDGSWLNPRLKNLYFLDLQIKISNNVSKLIGYCSNLWPHIYIRPSDLNHSTHKFSAHLLIFFF